MGRPHGVSTAGKVQNPFFYSTVLNYQGFNSVTLVLSVERIREQDMCTRSREGFLPWIKCPLSGMQAVAAYKRH